MSVEMRIYINHLVIFTQLVHKFDILPVVRTGMRDLGVNRKYIIGSNKILITIETTSYSTAYFLSFTSTVTMHVKVVCTDHWVQDSNRKYYNYGT